MPPVRIAVLSDDRLFGEGLLRILGAESSFIAVGGGDGSAQRPALRAARPDVLLVDSRMEGALGLCASLDGEGPTAVIFVAAPDDDGWALEALGVGARGIMAKTARVEDLVKAIRVVHEGQIWARRQVMAAWMERLAGASGTRRAGAALLDQRLSSREREVFRHAATGMGNKELADRLAISPATVKVHLTHIFQKLGVRSRAELAAAYHGIVPPPGNGGQAARPPARQPERAGSPAEGAAPRVVRLKA